MKNPPTDINTDQAPSTLTAWTHRHRRPLGLTFAAAAAGMTGLWLVMVPAKAEQTSGLQEFAIRWGHPACWALLAAVGLLVAAGAPKRVRDGAAIAAAICYAAFIAGMVL
ncbi:hypothetical protein [Blastococcus sp. Marseille-P5729]|uniref:hypothetical protein n=1 Tax=Blastococcus sp. Marseille-P5729 TaxID=2086582 RepID=UPI000D0FEDE7|nr:hypothetical protein [Blastococcus sp. Marseille-P5729]